MDSLLVTARNRASRNRLAAVAVTTALVLGMTAACGSGGGASSSSADSGTMRVHQRLNAGRAMTLC